MISPARINKGFPGFPMRGNTPAFPDFRRMSALSKELWTPAEITTALWLDAADSDTLTLDGSSNVEQWNDKSGNSRHMTQETGGKRPTYVAGEYVEFSYANATILENSSRLGLATNPTIAFFSVILFSSLTDFDDSFFQIGEDEIGNIRLAVGPLSTDGWAWRHNNGNNRYGATDTGVVSVPVFYRKSGDTYGDQLFRLNGSSITSIDSTNPTEVLTSTSAKCSVGGGGTLEASKYFTGRLYEFLAIPTDNVELIQKIEGYLAHKWGLEANLPSDHPYKTKAPYK
jgi:hypothetical protein